MIRIRKGKALYLRKFILSQLSTKALSRSCGIAGIQYSKHQCNQCTGNHLRSLDKDVLLICIRNTDINDIRHDDWYNQFKYCFCHNAEAADCQIFFISAHIGPHSFQHLFSSFFYSFIINPAVFQSDYDTFYPDIPGTVPFPVH